MADRAARAGQVTWWRPIPVRTRAIAGFSAVARAARWTDERPRMAAFSSSRGRRTRRAAALTISQVSRGAQPRNVPRYGQAGPDALAASSRTDLRRSAITPLRLLPRHHVAGEPPSRMRGTPRRTVNDDRGKRRQAGDSGAVGCGLPTSGTLSSSIRKVPWKPSLATSNSQHRRPDASGMPVDQSLRRGAGTTPGSAAGGRACRPRVDHVVEKPIPSRSRSPT